MDGQGTYTFSDGFRYVGKWKNDKRHGYGEEGFPDKDSKTGYWMYGMYVGQEKPEGSK